ncbi:hypothetical protein F5Y09DRAFT_346952 [Xylaria sp. FL1042]|nr:hypothetical protein F5Y09DRAFT_346952 [Xylaria sp. FL1042]
MSLIDLDHLSTNIREENQRELLEDYESIISDSKVFCLHFAVEDEHGYKELQFYEQDFSLLLPVASKEEKLKESLMTAYSQLRSIERFVIAVDHDYGCAQIKNYYRILRLIFYDMSHNTLLEYENKIVNWCTIGQGVQQMVRSQISWRNCNQQYELGRIPPMRSTNPLNADGQKL